MYSPSHLNAIHLARPDGWLESQQREQLHSHSTRIWRSDVVAGVRFQMYVSTERTENDELETLD